LAQNVVVSFERSSAVSAIYPESKGHHDCVADEEDDEADNPGGAAHPGRLGVGLADVRGGAVAEVCHV